MQPTGRAGAGRRSGGALRECHKGSSYAFSVTELELLLLNHALNEVCHGVTVAEAHRPATVPYRIES